MISVHEYLTVANGASGRVFFGPFAPGDVVEAVFCWFYRSTPLATIRFGTFPNRPASGFNAREFSSVSAMLLPNIDDSVAGDPPVPTMVLFPLGEPITLESRVVGMEIDNAGGAEAVTMLVMVQVTKGFDQG